jgi:hypothetical protein
LKEARRGGGKERLGGEFGGKKGEEEGVENHPHPLGSQEARKVLCKSG